MEIKNLDISATDAIKIYQINTHGKLQNSVVRLTNGL